MSKKRKISVALAGLAGALLLLSGCASTTPSGPSEWDGLKRVERRNVDQLFVVPDAQIGPFSSVILEPAQVSFDQNWDPNRNTRSLGRRISQADMDRIRTDVGRMLDETFARELTQGGYKIVTAPESETVRISPAIVNLYINAPDTMSAGRSQTFVMDAGRMTLFSEFRDAYSGKLLARAVDTQSGSNFGQMQVSNSVTNSAEAQRAMTNWARTLVRGLDSLHKAP
jgi:hypothetical protein